jgi:hypothetical protein
VVNWLRESSESSNPVKIYSSHTSGSWNTLVNESSIKHGCVLIHESAVDSVCEVS